MNDGQYTNLRNYLEEIASQQKQLLGEVKRTNELLAGKQGKPTETPVDSDGFIMGKAVNVPKEAVGPVTVETVQTIDKPDAHLDAVTQKVDTQKGKSPVEVTPETNKPDFTVTVEDEPRAAKKSGDPQNKPNDKKGKPGKPGNVTPQVNWNS